MSTRMTIASGKSWHLYEDATDETVWLETYGESFQARTGEAGLRLPSAAIDAIRTARSGCFPHLRGPCGERVVHDSERGDGRLSRGEGRRGMNMEAVLDRWSDIRRKEAQTMCAKRKLTEGEIDRAMVIGKWFFGWTDKTGPCPIGCMDEHWHKKLCALFEWIAVLESEKGGV